MLIQDSWKGKAFRSLGYFVLLCCCPFFSSTAEAAYLFLANGNNNILRYDTATSAYLGVFATGKTGLPVDLEFGPDGMLYVLSDAVYRYDGLTGAYIDQIVDSSTSPITGARAIAFGPQPVPAPSSLVTLIGVGMMVGGMEWWKKRRRHARSKGRGVE